MLVQQALDILSRHEKILGIELRLSIALRLVGNGFSHDGRNQLPALEGLYDRGLIADHTPVREQQSELRLAGLVPLLET